MPVVEVIHASEQPSTRDQKQTLSEEFRTIFQDVLGTPDGRLRVFFYSLDVEDSNAGGQRGEQDNSQGSAS